MSQLRKRPPTPQPPARWLRGHAPGSSHPHHPAGLTDPFPGTQVLGGVAVTTGYALPLVEGHWGVCVCECFPSAFFSLHCIQHAGVLSRVQLTATLWTVAHQAPLSRGVSRRDYWTGLPCPPPGGIFLIQRSNPHLLCLLNWQMDSLPLTPCGKPLGCDHI